MVLGMARPPRFEYPGAVYHVMARGDGGKRIFIGREDHESFLHWLERVCTSHGWRVHAWILMGNHFHLLLETPVKSEETHKIGSSAESVGEFRFG
jgi:putative transposase